MRPGGPTSFGTLAVPAWFLMAPGRLCPGRILAYLGTLAAFYAAVGFAVMAGAGWVVEHHADLLGSRPVMAVGLVAGVGLFWWSFRLDSPAAKERSRSGAGRLSGWRQRAVGTLPETPAEPGATAAGRQSSGLGALVALALTAGLAEVATMLPYLAAIGLIMAQGPGWPASGLLLMAYCAVMMLPALVLLAGSILARRLMERPGPAGRLVHPARGQHGGLGGGRRRRGPGAEHRAGRLRGRRGVHDRLNGGQVSRSRASPGARAGR